MYIFFDLRNHVRSFIYPFQKLSFPSLTLGAMQKVCHSWEGGGGLVGRVTTIVLNDVIYCFLSDIGGGGLKIPIMGVTYFLHGP